MEKEERAKRTVALGYLCLISFAIYAILILISFIANLNIHYAWFSIAILLIGAILIIKSIFYFLDSSLWLGMTLFLCGFVGIFNNYFNFENIIALYFIASAFSAFINYIIFRQKLYLLLFALFSFEVLLLSVISFENIIFWYFQGAYILFVSLMLFFKVLNLVKN